MTTDKTIASPPALRRRAPLSTQRFGAPDDFETKHVVLDLIEEADVFRLRHPPYDGIVELAEDIRSNGQSTPLFVRPKEDAYELISGYRRRAALKLIQAPTAFCRIYRDLSDADGYKLAVSENQSRADMTDLERAEICGRFQREGMTTDEIARHMGWTQHRNVFYHLRLAKDASPVLRAALQARSISLTIGLALIEAKSAELGEHDERALIDLIVEKEMTVRDVKLHIARLRKAPVAGDTSRKAGSSTRRSCIRELRGGAFLVNARIDPAQPDGLDDMVAALDAAAKRARQLQRKLARELLEQTTVKSDAQEAES